MMMTSPLPCRVLPCCGGTATCVDGQASAAVVRAAGWLVQVNERLQRFFGH
jgi:hypothetical protein